MKRFSLKIKSALLISTIVISSCGSEEDSNFFSTTNTGSNNNTGGESYSSVEITENDPVDTTTLHAAFAEFNEDYTDIYLDGENVIIETNGFPDHTTPYYSEDHPLYVERTVATGLTPTKIDTSGRDFGQVLEVSQNPQKANSTTNTSLGSIGIAVSGAAIFNDQEGNGTLDSAAGSLDYTGGHIGPGVYHYHLEPKAYSYDDDNLVGIISDGFFIYGRKCNSTGTYPTDLDASGGHTHTTQHSDGEEYHYHIINEMFTAGSLTSYILFAGPYQGTPNAIN